MGQALLPGSGQQDKRTQDALERFRSDIKKNVFTERAIGL